MGDIIKALFGGSSSKNTQQQQSTSDSYSQSNSQQQSTNESGNKFGNALYSSAMPAVDYIRDGGDALGRLLGLHGGGDQQAAQAAWRDTPGYQFQQDEGQRALNANSATRGVLQSGAAAKSMAKFSQGLADQSYNSYLDRLVGYSGIGQGAGQLVNSAGQYSTGQSTGSSLATSQSNAQSTGSGSGSSSEYSGGLGKFIGALMVSDRRLKENIVKTDEKLGNLRLYDFNYKGDPQSFRGIMAQDVEKLYPEAVSDFFGYKMIDLTKIPLE